MDKVTINNQVVLMRKFVKQAKIRAINNYTKEIRKLQNRRGSDDETSKHKRKAERLLAKVVILRKIQPDTVSRKALAKEKDWKAVLKEKNIPLEDQCYALLANYGAVQTEVEKFHKKNWDLVPKMATYFKDWEEKSKDPNNKQQRKEAKRLRKSMKHVRLEKDSSNAIPIGVKSDDEAIKNKSSPNKSASNDSLRDVENTQEAVVNEKVENKLSQNDSKPVPLSAVRMDSMEIDETSDNEKEEIKQRKIIPRKVVNPSKTSLTKNNFKAVKMLNLNELQDSDDDTHIEKINGISPNKNTLGNSLMNVENTEEASENIDEQVNSTPAQNDSTPNSLSIAGINKIEEEETSDSENEEIKEKTFTPKNKSPVKSQVKKTPQDIQSRLKAISNNNQKANTRGNKQLKLKVNPSKTSVSKNNLKAVRMLNLNELLDMDEIPIEKPNDIAEETEEKTRKKDPFFLGKGGEVPSESEDEDSANREQEKAFPAFKKRKFETFDRNSDDFPKRRRLPSDSSPNPRSNFRDNGFQRNQRNSSFGDRSNSFKNKEQQSSDFKSKGFKSKSFDEKFPSQQFKQNSHTEGKNKEHFQKNNSSSLKKNTTDEKPLHPSWEAKKKLKEASISKFQGKRIVFDD